MTAITAPAQQLRHPKRQHKQPIRANRVRECGFVGLLAVDCIARKGTNTSTRQWPTKLHATCLRLVGTEYSASTTNPVPSTPTRFKQCFHVGPSFHVFWRWKEREKAGEEGRKGGGEGETETERETGDELRVASDCSTWTMQQCSNATPLNRIIRGVSFALTMTINTNCCDLVHDHSSFFARAISCADCGRVCAAEDARESPWFSLATRLSVADMTRATIYCDCSSILFTSAEGARSMSDPSSAVMLTSDLRRGLAKRQQHDRAKGGGRLATGPV